MIDLVNPDYANTPVSGRRPSYHYQPVDPYASPYVTIVTPFYNTGPVFHQTAQSVLQQSLQQWEWLIINDGSTDAEALAILDTYRQRDPRIRVIDHQTNEGLSAARNTGFRSARTAYVVQLDSDDLLEPTAVEKWVWFLESYPEFAFVTGYSVGFGALEYLWTKGFHSAGAFREDNLVNATCAIRRSIHEAVGGYDETMRQGCEDWDFWLRCASTGHWGGTLPEHLDWYRRRADHSDRWAAWDKGENEKTLRAELRRKYSSLWEEGFPHIQVRGHLPYDTVPDVLPCENRLRKEKPRLLLIVPWLTIGGADKFNLQVVKQVQARGWEVTIATTQKGDHSWLPEFAGQTPDIFALSHFLRVVDYPRFLRYLIHSRQINTVLITNSELGYLLLPYLRAHFPSVTFLDFCHAETEYWKNGGNPRMAVEYQEILDLNLVASEHLKRWMVGRGADPQMIRTCYINVDTEHWCPDKKLRQAARAALKVAEETPLILYVGRICFERPPQVLGRTLLSLARTEQPFVALVAGDGPEFGWLQDFISTHDLGKHVRLLGAVTNERVRELMAAADVFFLPSRWEGIALSIYEAMACGLPIVGADVGGQRELVTPESGILVQRSDEETEAKFYSETLLTLLQDANRRAALGRCARERVSRYFRLEHMGMRMVSLLLEAEQLRETRNVGTLSLGLGRTCAVQAIEYRRACDLADALWGEREASQPQSPPPPPSSLPPQDVDLYGGSWRTPAYFALRNLFLPYYRAAIRCNIPGLPALKGKIKHLLRREAVSDNLLDNRP